VATIFISRVRNEEDCIMKPIIGENKKVKFLKSDTYNYIFNKENGQFFRWGKTRDDDPLFSPFGPEILDLEISKGRCLGGCKFCSPSGTKVNTDEGLKNIEDLKVGDYVLSYNESNQSYKKNIIQEVYDREYVGDLLTIELEDGTELKLTPEHPVYVKNKGWMNAGNLNEGDEVKTIIEYTNEFCKNCGNRIIKGKSVNRFFCSEKCFSEKHLESKCFICGKNFNKSLNKHFCLNCLNKMNVDNSHSLSTTYRDMIYRCYIPSRINYSDYGGKGITVCDRWLNFKNFCEDVGERPLNHTLDRINSNGNYEPDNVRWSNKYQQRINRNMNKSSRKYRGVWQTNEGGGFQASVKFQNENIYLGTFFTEEEAALAYNEKVKELYPNDKYLYFLNNVEVKDEN
jgi:hypothetical protein